MARFPHLLKAKALSERTDSCWIYGGGIGR
jgi:hypothetical protein